jgi:hypothetical protein
LDGAGSTLFTLTWRQKATPLGRPYYQLAASGLRISDNDCGSWATPAANQANGEPEAFLERKRRSVARGSQMGVSLTDLQMQAKLARWPTPCVVEPTTHPDKVWERKQRLTEKTGVYRGNDCGLGSKAQLASWPSPTVGDSANTRNSTAKRNKIPPTGIHAGNTLVDMTSQLASWPTPHSKENGGGEYKDHKKAAARFLDKRRNNDLNDAVHLAAPGPISFGSPAQMENKGQLNPEFSLWLMGYPPEWPSCAPRVMPSSRKSRPKSSGR